VRLYECLHFFCVFECEFVLLEVFLHFLRELLYDLVLVVVLDDLDLDDPEHLVQVHLEVLHLGQRVELLEHVHRQVHQVLDQNVPVLGAQRGLLLRKQNEVVQLVREERAHVLLRQAERLARDVQLQPEVPLQRVRRPEPAALYLLHELAQLLLHQHQERRLLKLLLLLRRTLPRLGGRRRLLSLRAGRSLLRNLRLLLRPLQLLSIALPLQLLHLLLPRMLLLLPPLELLLNSFLPLHLIPFLLQLFLSVCFPRNSNSLSLCCNHLRH